MRTAPAELVIGRRLLWLAGSVLVIALLLIIGHLNSPRLQGHPLLLSPANWRLTRYLTELQDWLGILRQEYRVLASMVPPVEPNPGNGLPLLATPSGGFTVYERSRALQRCHSHLSQVRRSMEGTEAPPVLQPLHALALATADELLDLHGAVATVLSSPSMSSRETANAKVQTASDHLMASESALQAQLDLLGSDTATASAWGEGSRPYRNVYLPLLGEG